MRMKTYLEWRLAISKTMDMEGVSEEALRYWYKVYKEEFLKC